MDRVADLKNCVQMCESDHGVLCNHVGFLDHHVWGYSCGNCGASFKFKEGLKRDVDEDARDMNKSNLKDACAVKLRDIAMMRERLPPRLEADESYVTSGGGRAVFNNTICKCLDRPFQPREKVAVLVSDLLNSIPWLIEHVHGLQQFRDACERPKGVRNAQCCDPTIDGELGALLKQNKELKTQIEMIVTDRNRYLTEREACMENLADCKAALRKVEQERDSYQRQAMDGEAELEAHATDRVNQRAEVARLKQERDALATRCAEQSDAIRNQRGDDVCWIKDEGEAKALPKAEFHESCERHRLKIASETGEFTGGRTIAQLEADNETLRVESEKLQAVLSAARKIYHRQDSPAVVSGEHVHGLWDSIQAYDAGKPSPDLAPEIIERSSKETLRVERDAALAELKRIGDDKAYVFRANIANEWEERLECFQRIAEMKEKERDEANEMSGVYKKERDAAVQDSERLQAVIDNGWRLIHLHNHKNGPWHVHDAGGLSGTHFGTGQTPREAIDAAMLKRWANSQEEKS